MKSFDPDHIITTLGHCENIADPAQYYQEIRQLKTQFDQDPSKRRLADWFEILGNCDRLLILDALASRDRCVCELEAILGKSQPAVSHHLRQLERLHFIRGWKKGKFTHYSLVQKTFSEVLDLWKVWTDSISNWFGT